MYFMKEKYESEFIIESKEGRQVKIKIRDISNVGKGVSLYGNKDVSSRSYTYIQYNKNNRLYNFPAVSEVIYDEESDLLLIKDYVEYYDNYSELDKPIIEDIYYYIDFEGNILTDAYSPRFNIYFKLLVPNPKRKFPTWMKVSTDYESIFKRDYLEAKEEIGFKMDELRDKNIKEIKQKLIERKRNINEDSKC